jgi:hypothetical protein
MRTLSIDPRLSAQAIFTAERNARTKFDLYRVLFSIDGVLADTVFIERKDDDSRRYRVMLDELARPVSCTCKFAEKNAICLHQFIVARAQEIAAVELAEEDFAQREDAALLMRETSREHNVNFAAEILADTAAEWDPEPYDNQTDYADGWH